MANSKISDRGRTGTTRHLTRILNILTEVDEPLIFADIMRGLGGDRVKVRDALNWLVGRGIVFRGVVKCHRGKGKGYRYDAVCYRINSKFLWLGLKK